MSIKFFLNLRSDYRITPWTQKFTGKRGWSVWFWRFYILIAPKLSK